MYAQVRPPSNDTCLAGDFRVPPCQNLSNQKPKNVCTTTRHCVGTYRSATMPACLVSRVTIRHDTWISWERRTVWMLTPDFAWDFAYRVCDAFIFEWFQKNHFHFVWYSQYSILKLCYMCAFEIQCSVMQGLRTRMWPAIELKKKKIKLKRGICSGSATKRSRTECSTTQRAQHNANAKTAHGHLINK